MGQFVARVQETTTVVGTGAMTLLGAMWSYQPFSTAFPNASTANVPYAIFDPVNNAWEEGYGTYTLSSTTLSRDYVTNSSNAGALVNFAAGTKIVFCSDVSPAINWPLHKESCDSGEVIVIPANYVLMKPGNFTQNGGTTYVFGDIYHF